MSNNDQVEGNLRISSPTIYEVIAAEGQEELDRPFSSLAWSGLAAGICISFSMLTMGYIYLHGSAEGDTTNFMLQSIGYTFGFLIVVLGRLQLFTENTITVILPLLERKSMKALAATARLWGIVFVMNMVGTFLIAVLISKFGFATTDQLEAIIHVAEHAVLKDTWDVFVTGIPAGFLIAAMVWMCPGAKNNQFFIIFFMTFLIALGEFSHVVAGSAEAFLLAFVDQITFLQAWEYIIAAGAGNILGGTGLFALLAYAQVKAEM